MLFADSPSSQHSPAVGEGLKDRMRTFKTMKKFLKKMAIALAIVFVIVFANGCYFVFDGHCLTV